MGTAAGPGVLIDGPVKTSHLCQELLPVQSGIWGAWESEVVFG